MLPAGNPEAGRRIDERRRFIRLLPADRPLLPAPSGIRPFPPRREETVGFHMTPSMITVPERTPLLDACRRMSQHRIGCLPVTGLGGRITGVLTDRTLLRLVSRGTPLRGPASGAASPPVVVGANRPLHEAIDLLRERHGTHLLVADASGRIRGLVTQTGLLEASRRLLALAEERVARAGEMASRDALTGLFTRQVFDRALEDEFARSRRYGGLLAVLFLDLDHFKRVNDRYGHAAGDLVLRKIGEIVRRHARGIDVPSRRGGDELAVLMPGCGTRAARILGDRIRSELAARRFSSGGRRFRVTLSGGACKRVAAFRAPLDMMEEADRRMYEAKRKGRNRIEIPA